jgi:hypothetical protein
MVRTAIIGSCASIARIVVRNATASKRRWASRCPPAPTMAADRFLNGEEPEAVAVISESDEACGE